MKNPEYDEKLSVEENIGRGLFAVASAIRYAAWTLGTGDAATTLGAIEYLAVAVKDAGDHIAECTRGVANAIEEATPSNRELDARAALGGLTARHGVGADKDDVAREACAFADALEEEFS